MIANIQGGVSMISELSTIIGFLSLVIVKILDFSGHRNRLASVPFLFCSYKYCYAVDLTFHRVRYQSLTHAGNAPGTPCKGGLFCPLSRNKGASFPHTLGSLFPGDTLPAVRAVFRVVGA